MSLWFKGLPAGWEEAPLKSRLIRNDGGVWGEDPEGGDSDTFVLRSTEQRVDGAWNIEAPALRKLSKSEVESGRLELGDLVVTKSSGSELHIGKTSLVTAEVAVMGACYSNFMQRLRVDSRTAPRFVHYWMNNELCREQFAYLSNSTSGLANLNGTVLGTARLAFPAKEEQERIANFLDDKTARIDALIAEKEQLLSALDEMRTSRIWSAVTGQGAKDRQNVPASPWSPSIPRHWKVTPVGKFAKLQRGFDLPESEREDGGVPVMSGGGISGWHSVARVKAPGVVTGRYGTIGVLHYVEADYWPLNTSLFVEDFFGNNEKYAYYVLSFLPWDMLGGKSAVPGVNRNDVHPLLVGAPPRAEQDAIVASLDAELSKVSVLAEHAKAHIARLREYRSSLISAAVTGQLDISSDSENVKSST